MGKLVSLLCVVLGVILVSAISEGSQSGKKQGLGPFSRAKRSGQDHDDEPRKYHNGTLCPGENFSLKIHGHDSAADHDDENIDVGRSRAPPDDSDDQYDVQDPDDEKDYDKNSSIIIRVMTMGAIFIFSMIFGLLPLKTLNLKYRSRIASIANCFGGGVFFGTCFLHLIPEVKMQIKAYVTNLEDQYECISPPTYLTFLQKFPIAEFLECSGFLLILSIEKIAESATKIRPLTQRFSVFRSSSKRKALVKRQESNLEAVPVEDDGIQFHTKDSDDECDNSDTDIHNSDLRDHGNEHGASSAPTKTRVPEAFLSATKQNTYDKVPAFGTDPEVSKQKSAGLLIMALSIHSFFEGLAIGVEGTPAVFLQLAAAITLHKCVIAFAVGSRLTHSGKTIKSIVMLLGTMCIMTPVGISLAMIIVSNLDGQSVLIVSGTIQGVSTGFFLYITFAEMLFQEMESKQDSFLKVSFMTFGVCLVTASTVWHNWSGSHAGH